MTLAEFDNEVARIADTSGKPIDAAVVRRVIACVFDVLRQMTVVEAAAVVMRGLARAALRAKKCRPVPSKDDLPRKKK